MENVNDLLLTAVKNQQNCVIKKLLDGGVQPVGRDKNGNTLLILSIDSNSTLQMLIEYDCDVNESNEEGWTALHFAVSNGDLEATLILLKNNANPNTRTGIGKNSALHIAAMKGFTEILKSILKFNAKIDIKNGFKRTPLHLAVSENQIDTARILLEANSNPNVQDKSGKTPLMSAIKTNNSIIVFMLLKAGANMSFQYLLHNAIEDQQEDVTKILIEYTSNIDLKNDNGYAPISLASINGCDQIVKVLLTKGCKVDILDIQGWIPLHHAVHHGHLKVVEELLRVKFDYNQLTPDEFSALHLAVLGGHVHIIELLTSVECDLEVMDENGQTPLQLAVEEHQIDCAIKLLEIGSNPNVENKYGEKLISCAIRQGEIDFLTALLVPGKKISMEELLNHAIDTKQVDIVKMLLENGGYLKIEDGGLSILLRCLRKNYHPEIFDLLLKHGCKINTRDKNNQSLLHHAVVIGDINLLDVVIKAGADVDCRTNDGMTALHIAASLGYVDMIVMLFNAGGDINATAASAYETPFVFALCNKKTESLKKLLELGCTPYTSDENGMNLLSMAGNFGVEDFKDILLKTGAKPIPPPKSVKLEEMPDDQQNVFRLVLKNAELSDDDIAQHISTRDPYNWTALHHAVVNGQTDICVRFLNVGADPNCQAVNGYTPMHLAITSERINLIEILSNYGADIYIKNGGGNAPLEWAVLCQKPNCIMKMLEIHAKIEKDTIINVCDRQRLIITAAKSNLILSLKVLLSIGANPNICDTDGNYLLFTSINVGSAELMDILLSTKNIDLEVRENHKNQTPLLRATRIGDSSVVLKLIRAKVNVNVTDKEGETPLSYAVKRAELDVVKELLSNGAEVTSQHLLLHQAVTDNQIEIVDLLIKHLLSDINLCNEAGNTPLLLAAKTGNVEIAKILLDHGAMVNIVNSITESSVLHDAVENIEDINIFKEFYYCLEKYALSPNICLLNKGTPLYRAICLERDEIAVFLIKNGVNVKVCSTCDDKICNNLNLALGKNTLTVAKFIVFNGMSLPNVSVNNPWSLAHYARLVVRNHLPNILFVESIRSLPLPKTLQDFLLFDGYSCTEKTLEEEFEKISII